jgi:signal transduction histidine kinase
MTDHTHGAGLGLPLAQGLAELHGGRLAIASVPGDGFTATLDIPAA